jgi:hypothetical protein
VQVARPVGREAASRKYDLLTALATHALSGDKALQRRVLRFIALITARYNWQRDELAVGQAEIARQWSVDLRTVKREMAKLRACGWRVEKRAGARGRVAVHGIDMVVILADTKPDWAKVGPDFVDRLAGPQAPDPSDNVIAFQPPPRTDGSLWGKALEELHRLSPLVVRNWLAQAEAIDRTGGCLTIAVPTRFIAQYIEANLSDQIEQVLFRLDPEVRRIAVLVQ